MVGGNRQVSGETGVQRDPEDRRELLDPKKHTQNFHMPDGRRKRTYYTHIFVHTRASHSHLRLHFSKASGAILFMASLSCQFS